MGLLVLTEGANEWMGRGCSGVVSGLLSRVFLKEPEMSKERSKGARKMNHDSRCFLLV